MVGAAAANLLRLRRLHSLLDLGGLSGNALPFRSLSLAVLLAGVVWRFAAQLVWDEAGLVARLVAVLAGSFDFMGSGWIAAHLLLLSRRLLQSDVG